MVAALLSTISVAAGPRCSALPSDDEIIVPLPPVNVTKTNWVPKFPFPYDQTKSRVTDADIVAMGEMCQWYNGQYDILRRQIDRLQFNRVQPFGPGIISGAASDWDYSYRGTQEQADIVTANIDQSVDFLTPRVNALTRAADYASDDYFPIYEGKSFFLIWQDLSNASNGLKSHQPAWFTGAPILQFKRYGSRIGRSHVCD
ncbi:hypothetical protein ACT18_22340 [Mycolicibacter kumamotonensis]|uniref:Uncharacterized protein n=2 Tax=Mycolicibacter kumamotonensis TaxID=354243 RepID=A0A1B8SA68_9MYCO|nr:hypothetical protein ACT18_22340 [Mycolicibacter kumamotonensis]